MKKSPLILLTVMAGVVLAGCSANKPSSVTLEEPLDTVQVTAQPESDTGDSAQGAPGFGENGAGETSELADLLQGGSSYAAPDGSFSFLYPEEYQIEPDRPEGVRIMKIGPSSRPQSEISDGVSILFTPLDLSTSSLEDQVDQAIEEIATAGIAEMTEQKSAVSFNGVSGYTYSARGLGEFTHLYLENPAGSDTGLAVVYLVSDPNGNDYQAEVDAVLKSIEIQ